jgi:hypothetical protein
MLPIMRRAFIFLFFTTSYVACLWAATGQEGAGFLDIPVGAEPAALGSAYTALANNAYAMAWNPAGLARLDIAQVAATHLSYLESINYEYLSAGVPLHEGPHANGVGFSVQSLNSGSIDQFDVFGNETGSFSTSFDAYTFGYGQALGDQSALGIAGKAIREKISDATATAYAVDFGWLYYPQKNLSVGAAISNLGTSLKLVDQKDPLPLQGRVGVGWRFETDFQFSDDVIYRQEGPVANALGVEWSNSAYYALRAGYNTSHEKELGIGAGFSAGIALHYWGQEFSYAWVPFGDLGNTNYFSLLIRFTTAPRADRAYPELPKVRLKGAKTDEDHLGPGEAPATGYHDYNNIEDILTPDERRSLKKFNQDPKDSE